jgi:DNA-binding transcriptional ArsR family regulator
MTARSKRREAELAVIEAARTFGEHYRTNEWPDVSVAQAVFVAIEKLDALDLEAPDAVRTGDNNPCLTSSQAAEYFRKHAKHRVAEVFTAIYKVYLGGGVGLTVDQLEVQLGRTHQSVSPRLTELRDKGLVKDSGQTLLTRSKQRATVWTPTDVAIEAAKHDGLPWSWQ